MLRLVDLYTLWAIGYLNDRDAALLEGMTPRLRKTFACDGTWQDCVRKALALPQNMPELIRERWDHNRGLAERNGEALDPGDFTRMFVDANFPRESEG